MTKNAVLKIHYPRNSQTLTLSFFLIRDVMIYKLIKMTKNAALKMTIFY